MSELKIVAVIEVKPEYKDEILKVLQTVVDASRKESGNISYDLYQEVKEPLKYTILETWKSQDSINEHNNTAHFKKFVQDIEGKVNSLEISVLQKSY